MHKNTGSLSIKNWNEDDRPREKLTVKGKGSLTDAELVAIIIGSGNREESAVTLSKRILASVAHQIDALGKLSIKQLTSFHGIGEAKAIAIVAALELGRRRKNEAIPVIPKISCSKDAYEMLRPMIGDLQHEEFWVIYLNNANKVLCKKQISSGGKTGTIVDSRLVFKNALEFDATTKRILHFCLKFDSP